MTTLLAQRMGVLLRDAGLPAGAALAFEVGSDDRVRVASARPDAAQLQALVDAHPDVQVLVRLLQAINAAPVAALAATTLAALAAPQLRVEGDAAVDAAAAPGPPLFHPLGWWARRRDGAPRAQAWRVWLVWLAAAVLAIVGWVLWR